MLDSTSGSERAQQVRERLRKRKKIQKVAVDEGIVFVHLITAVYSVAHLRLLFFTEPEEVDKTKRHLAVEDDFFLVSAS